jgi:hypothetical protein
LGHFAEMTGAGKAAGCCMQLLGARCQQAVDVKAALAEEAALRHAVRILMDMKPQSFAVKNKFVFCLCDRLRSPKLRDSCSSGFKSLVACHFAM